jgi:hypothetical protein
MKLRVKLPMILCFALPIILAILFQGCGNNTDTTPAGSTITFNPTGFTYSAPATICLSPINVIVRYPDGAPIPKANVTISGGFAVPNVDPVTVSGSGLYQFYSAPNCSGVAVDSGFQAKTDDTGVYSFSVVIPGLITGLTSTGAPYSALNSFTDKLVATSDTAVVTADIKFN